MNVVDVEVMHIAIPDGRLLNTGDVRRSIFFAQGAGVVAGESVITRVAPAQLASRG